MSRSRQESRRLAGTHVIVRRPVTSRPPGVGVSQREWGWTFSLGEHRVFPSPTPRSKASPLPFLSRPFGWAAAQMTATFRGGRRPQLCSWGLGAHWPAIQGDCVPARPVASPQPSCLGTKK